MAAESEHQRVVIVLDEQHRIASASGLPDGAEIQLRNPDMNYGEFIDIFEVCDGKPVYVCQKVLCVRCQGGGKAFDDGEPCCMCKGSGFEP